MSHLISVKLAALDARGSSDDVAKLYLVAINIIRFFLGEEFFEQHIKLSTNPDPYMANNISEDTYFRFLYQHRVASLADYLYRLRRERGFDILLDRFTSGRDMRSLNLEAMIASCYKTQGFFVEILPLTGVRGQDFDFKASRGVEIINVEVTGLTNARFTPENIRNVLQGKRSQLPDSAPGILYCIVPQAWLNYSKYLGSDVHGATKEFYKRSGTRRINAIVYVMPQVYQVGKGAAFFEEYLPIINPNDIHHPIDLSFIIQEQSETRNLIQDTLAASPKTPTSKLDSFSYWHFIRLSGHSED